MFAGSAGGSVKMRNKGHRNNLIKVNGFIKKREELIFIIVEFILAIGKNICQSKLFIWYHNTVATPFRWMVDCFSTIQFYHKPVRSCFIFTKKKHRNNAEFGVSQTPIKMETGKEGR